MSNPITYTTLSAANFVDSSSRYLNSSVIYYGTDNLITFTTYKRTPIPFTSTDQYFLIDKAREYRPDLVSQLSYGTPNFWWRIMQANGMIDILQFRSGVNIRIPNTIF